MDVSGRLRTQFASSKMHHFPIPKKHTELRGGSSPPKSTQIVTPKFVWGWEGVERGRSVSVTYPCECYQIVLRVDSSVSNSSLFDPNVIDLSSMFDIGHEFARECLAQFENNYTRTVNALLADQLPARLKRVRDRKNWTPNQNDQVLFGDDDPKAKSQIGKMKRTQLD